MIINKKRLQLPLKENKKINTTTLSPNDMTLKNIDLLTMRLCEDI